MAKNIPITARVSRGLFGQKATEPVLNVGQAGVYGNNVTKRDPSPAKMMNSPFKQVNKSKGAGDKIIQQGQANANIGSKEPDTVVKGKPPGTANIDNVKNTYNKQMPPGWKPTEEERAAANKREADARAKDAASGTPDQLIKGEDTKEKIPLTTFNEGSAKTSYWRRQDDRSVTHTSRKKKRADIKLGELDAKEKGLKGKDKRDHINEAKHKAKKEMWEARQAGYKGSRDAAVKQNQQSVVIHGAVKGVSLDPKGEQILHANQIGNRKGLTPEEDAMAQVRAREGYNISKEKDAASPNPLTNKPAGTAAEKKSVEVKAAEKLDEAPKTSTSQMTEDDDPSSMPKSPAEKRANGFFAKRPPLKMKYFK
jgi:hypothetical protein